MSDETSQKIAASLEKECTIRAEPSLSHQFKERSSDELLVLVTNPPSSEEPERRRSLQSESQPNSQTSADDNNSEVNHVPAAYQKDSKWNPSSTANPSTDSGAELPTNPSANGLAFSSMPTATIMVAAGKSKYRPKASSLPTSLARIIYLDDDGGYENRIDDKTEESDSNEAEDGKMDEKSGDSNCSGIGSEYDNENVVDSHKNSETVIVSPKNKIPTTLILQLFSDRIFISITQLSGKMGSMLVCNVEESIIDNSTTYHIRTLLGTGVARGVSNGRNNTNEELALREVFVRRLAERMVIHARKMAGIAEGAIIGGSEDGVGPIPLLLVGLALRPQHLNGGKRLSLETFNTIVEAAMELYEEGCRISQFGPNL